MSVRFIHAADLHLGSPLRAISGASEEMRDQLARATQESFRRIVATAIDRDVDFVAIAGDLYDREARSVRANQFLVDQFERLSAEGIPAYVVHGNHDPLGDGAEKLDLPDSVYVFSDDDVETVHYPNKGDPEARVLGQSYGSKHESNKLYYSYNPPDTTIPNIGLLHTGLNPDGRKYAPCRPDDLASKDLDYWALGHLHSPHRVTGAPAAYSGIPQGRHSEELGAGGCLLVEIDSNSDPDIEFVPTSPIVWENWTVDLEDTDNETTLQNLTDLETHLEDYALEAYDRDTDDLVNNDFPVVDNDWEPEGVICRWTLTGHSDVYTVLEESSDDEASAVLTERLRDRLDDLSPFVWTETVRDRVSPPLPDRETLIEEDEVIAELVTLTDELRDDSDTRRELRGEAGELWEWVDDQDREDTPPDRLPLDDDRLDDLIDQALNTAISELALRRHSHNVD